MADTYSLGSIPPLSAWEGETLTFKVTSTLGERTRFVKRAIPSPTGRTFIDEKTGSFTYEPSPEDNDEFAVSATRSTPTGAPTGRAASSAPSRTKSAATSR